MHLTIRPTQRHQDNPMNKPLKAALLSAFVFPGIGHFSLKKPVTGVLLSGVAIICLYYLSISVMEVVDKLSAQIESGEIPMDVEIINEVVSQKLLESDTQNMNTPSLVLVICWLIGIVDPFRIGWLQRNNGDS